MYRTPTCAHCRERPGQQACPSCDLWMCEPCGSRGCDRGAGAWTGKCRFCGTRYPSDQILDVADGEGKVRCERCGIEIPLLRFSRLADPAVRDDLAEFVSRCPRCNRAFHRDGLGDLLVSREQWAGLVFYHLLCTCSRALAFATRTR